MLRDVFYYGKKPNVHPRERFATSVEDARSQCTTEHFWIINEYCDYRNFDWDWDFEFLPDEDVWAQEHNNVWPSTHQKDSGTWLCSAEPSEIIIYRADIDPVKRKNEKNDNWVLLDLVDETKFDFSWHPDPTDPPYIYTWGCKFFPVELQACLEYHVHGATTVKYMDNIVELLPQTERWVEVQEIDKSLFDMSWRPNPLDPPMNYVWGNKYIDGKLKSTLEYHMPSATETMYMSYPVPVLPEYKRWKEIQPVDKSKFDFSWRPDPREPSYIYVWGNKYEPAEILHTLEYHCNGATEIKYMNEPVDVMPQWDRWKLFDEVDKTSFDFSWRPDPKEPALIYAWGNQWNKPEDKISIQYVVPGATEIKYMTERIVRLPCMEYAGWVTSDDAAYESFDYSWEPNPHDPPYVYMWGNKHYGSELSPTISYTVPGATEVKHMSQDVKLTVSKNWVFYLEIDKTKFDLTWRPDPTSPPYIYVWGNKYDPAEVKPTLEYIVPGATEYKYMDIVDLEPEWDRWKEIQPIDKNKFDFSWRPDPNLHEPPYIYVWGNKHIAGELKATLEYHVPGATERKYMDELADVLPEQDRWKEIQSIDRNKFDLSWRPDPTSPPYIYVWGNKHIAGELKATLEYHVPSATERKYMSELVEVLPEFNRWKEIQSIDRNTFDLTWRPDPREPAYIYVWGNKHISAELKSTIEYHCDGATDRKYMDTLADVLPEQERWKVTQEVKNFDFTWRPDPREPAYIYTWGNKHIAAELKPTVEYYCEGATERKYMGEVEVIPEMDRWNIVQEISNTFDLSWRPDPREPAYIYTWGNKYIPGDIKPTLEYHCDGATERKYMGDVDVIPELDKWKEIQSIDKTKFDLAWRPDPREPAYIYVWGNKHISGDLKATLEYYCTSATERKYMGDIEVLPEYTRWKEIQPVDKTKFDMTWRPDPREPAYIYVWGNKHVEAELKSTLEYHCPEATERKYMSDVNVLPELDKWKITQEITDFDLTWRPDPREPAYIYTWGNKHISAELKPTIEYYCEGATERKYMGDVEVLPELDKWKITQEITDFDLTWRPDPREPAYIYVWGNKWISGELKPTIEYYCEGATERKYMGDVDVLPELEKWKEIQPVDKTKFDMTWRPDPREPAFIYVWGNKHISAELKSTLEYQVEGAFERKYMGDIEVLPEFDKWNIVQQVENFDFTWRPDPREPAYIYTWGNKHINAELKPTLEYHCTGATERKYMSEVDVVPEKDKWKEIQPVDKTKFDMTWRPDPREPAFIYVWGNKHISAELKPTIEYHCDGATERKYMGDVEVLPEFDKWNIVQQVENFDFTWRPDPREPAYIYVWGNKWIQGDLKSTLEYHCDGATEIKYMKDLLEVAPLHDKWNVVQQVENFDFSWRPDPREPAYIYVWGNKHIAGELKSTLEFHCEGAVERKFIGNVEVAPEWDRYSILIPVDKTSFDFTWRPDPREPAFIYVWGNQSNSAEKEPTIEYHCPGAIERKYMDDKVAKTLPMIENWKMLIPVDNFDFSWRPDPDSPPYNYIFGNQWHDAMTEPTLEYHVTGATEKKFVIDIVPKVSKTQEYWKTLIPVNSFDYSWRPNPHSTPYIYVFGNQWHDSVTEPTIEYHTPGATDKKYITDVIGTVKSTATDNHWKRLIPIESFDYSWRPDPNSPPYIYVFGNKWNPATTEPSIEYHVDGATEYKYVTDPVAIPKAEIQHWAISNNDDLETFDFTWRPNPHSPAQIYQWADNGPRYTVPGANDVVLMGHNGKTKKTLVNRYKIKTTLEDLISEHPEEVFWAINPDLNYDKFDFSWRPNEENFRHINVFGNEYSKNTQTYYINGPMYMLGNKEYNYVEEQIVQVDSNLSMFFIDRSNSESTNRFNELKLRYPQLQKTRYLNSWVETISRCINKSETKLFWVLNSELDYTDFEFDFYPSPWQMKMIHVFGTQWSHWGNTYMINKETFVEDTKYVKIIEHLSNLNFVKQRKAKATNLLYDIVYIDHSNMDMSSIDNLIIKYEKSYLNTFKNMLAKLPVKKEHYVWVASTICDYTNFDFTYICDPFAKEQLHVFPSDKQKFGDTFLIDVNKLRTLIEDMNVLEDYEKINYNQTQRVKRLPAPIIITEDDTHVSNINTEFDFPYAVFTTVDNKNIRVVDTEPMNVWDSKTKNIIITSHGGTRIVVPKEAKKYVESELYDYPYITSNATLAKSNPMDIVFLSNGETGAEENYQHLLKVTKGLPNRVTRVDGVSGRVAAYHAAAEASNTPWLFTVFAKLKVNDKFDWSWQPDRLQLAKHYVFHATNSVNGLEYGHMAMIAYNKRLTLANQGKGLDFTLDDEHEVLEINSGIANFNTDEWSTWRTAFREALKLKADPSSASKERLDVWLKVGNGAFAQYSIQGAQHAVEYYNEVNSDFEKLRLSYDWPWLRTFYENKYKL